MLQSYLHENDACLQLRQPWIIVPVDVTVSAHHFRSKCDSNMAVFINFIHPIEICSEAFLVSNGTQRNGRVINYDRALLTKMHIQFSKFHRCAEKSPIFANKNRVADTVGIQHVTYSQEVNIKEHLQGLKLTFPTYRFCWPNQTFTGPHMTRLFLC